VGLARLRKSKSADSSARNQGRPYCNQEAGLQRQQKYDLYTLANVGRQDRQGLAGGIHAGQRLTQEWARVERLRAEQESRWREPYSAACCCLSADQVGPASLLKAAEGCMALTDRFLSVVKCQTCRADRILVYNYFGILYIYIYIYNIVGLVNQCLIPHQCAPSPILLLHRSLTHAAMVVRPNWDRGQRPQSTGRVVPPSARQ
jgi:hypothetical protein